MTDFAVRNCLPVRGGPRRPIRELNERARCLPLRARIRARARVQADFRLRVIFWTRAMERRPRRV